MAVQSSWPECVLRHKTSVRRRTAVRAAWAASSTLGPVPSKSMVLWPDWVLSRLGGHVASSADRTARGRAVLLAWVRFEARELHVAADGGEGGVRHSVDHPCCAAVLFASASIVRELIGHVVPLMV